MKYRLSLTLAGSVLLLALTTGTLPAAEQTKNFESVPVKEMVTMIDLGAKKCIPCKMMAPILEKMEKVYDGKAAIVFIDVRKNREQAKRFGIRTIPTQIFFDSDGKEIYRHAGFMAEKDIAEQLKKMGVSGQEPAGLKGAYIGV
jgi:thioredoxin 1